ncbi:hypothetical protein M1397_01740 [Candidatus Marsarchaeota archaeon]|nr:hypothetical protein [Candidatus Marsarchaeota archaeon]
MANEHGNGKRGQSALEFLATYGWMLLVVVLVLAVIFGLGILNPSSFAATVCQLPNGLQCQSWLLSSNGLLTITIAQYTSSPIMITSVNCNSNKSSYYGAISTTTNIGVGSSAAFNLYCYSGTTKFTGSIGTVYTGYISVNYTSQSTSVSHTAIATAVLKVMS